MEEEIISICVVIDLYARKVLAYAISTNSDTALVTETFQKAYDLRHPPEGLIFHSDQGMAYAAFQFRKFVRNNG